MTVKEALMIDRYTEKEANAQIKKGAWLQPVDDVIEELNNLDDVETVEQIKNAIAEREKGEHRDHMPDGMALIKDGGSWLILSKCL